MPQLFHLDHRQQPCLGLPSSFNNTLQRAAAEAYPTSTTLSRFIKGGNETINGVKSFFRECLFVLAKYASNKIDEDSDIPLSTINGDGYEEINTEDSEKINSETPSGPVLSLKQDSWVLAFFTCGISLTLQRLYVE